jgi:hypothetical protein
MEDRGLDLSIVQILKYSQVHKSFCNIAFCKCEVDPTGSCVAKINLYSN